MLLVEPPGQRVHSEPGIGRRYHYLAQAVRPLDRLADRGIQPVDGIGLAGGSPRVYRKARARRVS
jgi:hypothetical protein